MNVSQIKFPSTGPEFFPTVTKRVSEYFKANNISRQGNPEMVVKSIFMFSLYFIPYFFIISAVFTSIWIYLGLFFIMGLGKAGIGLSVMHDANHNAYSKRAWINNLMGASLNIVGGHSFNWIVQHNVLHHTYTNIHGADEDITPRGALRMSPESDWKPMHRYQHVYGWFLYGLQTFVWIVFRDFARLVRYQKEGFIEKRKSSRGKEWVILIATKVLYFSYMFVIPLLLTPLSFIQIFLGFVIMHYVTGFILAIIFQPAHVIEGTAYPVPDEKGA